MQVKEPPGPHFRVCGWWRRHPWARPFAGWGLGRPAEGRVAGSERLL